ncbi:T9SS type A sorting domain-containing protein, partial [Escherichia coli]|nr:T9SS type A sorting domain-containing protein [Escherichia coli]
QVYPNPTSGMLQVKGEFSREAICKIYTIDGKMAGSIKMSSDNTINLTAYPAGQYILKIADHTQEAVTTIEITK